MARKFYKLSYVKLTELHMKDIPHGRESLTTIESSKGKFFPIYGSIDDKLKKLLNTERQKAITQDDQFINAETLYNYKRYTPLVSKISNNRHILRNNLFHALSDEAQKINNAFGGVDIHHIVELKGKASEGSRNILAKFNINIDDPINGIFLPEDPKGDDNIYHGSIHYKGSHSEFYSRYVYDTIKDAKTIKEIREALNKIKIELWEGTLSL